jgi:hypothetical protein
VPDLLSTYKPALGGSEPDALLEQIAAARSAVWEAACKVGALDIHMRDYWSSFTPRERLELAAAIRADWTTPDR